MGKKMRVDNEKLRRLRLENSWSQEKLADMSKLNLRTVQRIEQNGLASLRSCEVISRAFGLDAKELILDEALIDSDVDREGRDISRRFILVISILSSSLLLVLIELTASAWDYTGYQVDLISILSLIFITLVMLRLLLSGTKHRFYWLLSVCALAVWITPIQLLAQLAVILLFWCLLGISTKLGRWFSFLPMGNPAQ